MAEAEESDPTSHLKLSQLYTCLREHLDDRYIKAILKREGDVNYQIPREKTRLPNSVGRTALHFALSKRNVKTFNLLLNHGADFTVKNDEDASTVLHRILVEKHKKYYSDNWDSRGKIDDPYIDAVLSCHVQFDVHANPIDQHGLSHFHAACMTNNARAVEFFLNNDTPVDQAVKSDSPYFPGYTGLHFAVRFCAPRAAEILLDHGAEVHAKDALGMTALHVLLERNVRLTTTEKRGAHPSAADVGTNEGMMNLLLENDSRDHDGLTRFHVACAMRDSQLAKRFVKHVVDIDRAIPSDSPVAPGCTALHLAAQFSLDTVELLLGRGANLMAEDVNGTTPLDVCLARYNVEDVHSILQCRDELTNVIMSDGRTRLLDLLIATRSSSEFANFLRGAYEDVDACVPADSPLWPNYTALHLAITLYNRAKSLCVKRTYFQEMRDCLNAGADVSRENVHGHTVLHFAFRLREMDVVNLLLQYHKHVDNPVDEALGWSHLHLACAAMNDVAVEKLIFNRADAKSKVRSRFDCVPAGSSALHVAVAVGSATIINFLLRHAAVDVYATDDEGLTAIHRLLVINNPRPCVGLALLAAPNLQECVVDGLSHLHVACYFDCQSAVKRLLHLGANVNEIVRNPRLVEYRGLTPLHVAARRGYWEICRLLVQQGADVTTGILLEAIMRDELQEPFVAIVKRDNTPMMDGFNLLHLACKTVDVELAKVALLRCAVNEKTRCGGDTALHLLIQEASRFMHNHQRQLDVDTILKLLLDNGADVSLRNDAMQTPLIMADKLFYIYMDQPSESPCVVRVDSMLRSIKDFKSNPVDADGITHFHIACSWNNARVVSEYLGTDCCDVNERTDCFAEQFAGCTALHLTLSSQTKSVTGVEAQLRTVELLLEHGADVTAEDARGNTPLHTAAKYGPPRERLFEMIVRAGADINARNIYGETPLEILLKSRDVAAEEIDFFLSHGCRVNGYNPLSQKGYMALTFSARHHDTPQKLVFEAMINAPSVDQVDEDSGCTAIHNVVATGSPIISDDDYTDLIERLIKLGCDIDYRDRLGKTALHVAAQFQNDRAIAGLLSAGADVNVSDATGRSAFAYSMEPIACKLSFDDYHEGRNELIKRQFAVHVHKLQLGKLDVSPPNKRAHASVLRRKSSSLDVGARESFFKEIENTRDVRIGSPSATLLLSDFVSEIGAVAAYPGMTFVEREAVDDFFETSRAQLTARFVELAHILRLQYRKAVARFSLIDGAKVALTAMTGAPLPDHCAEAIFGFLKNSELKSLIEAAAREC